MSHHQAFIATTSQANGKPMPGLFRDVTTTPLRFERRFAGSKPTVLPLDDRAIGAIYTVRKMATWQFTIVNELGITNFHYARRTLATLRSDQIRRVRAAIVRHTGIEPVTPDL